MCSEVTSGAEGPWLGIEGIEAMTDRSAKAGDHALLQPAMESTMARKMRSPVPQTNGTPRLEDDTWAGWGQTDRPVVDGPRSEGQVVAWSVCWTDPDRPPWGASTVMKAPRQTDPAAYRLFNRAELRSRSGSVKR